MDFWILLLNWVWLHCVSCALIHLNPHIPDIGYREDFTRDIMPWTRDTVRNWFNNWGWCDNNIWKFWSLLCFSYFIGASIACSQCIYIIPSSHMEWVTCIFFPTIEFNRVKLIGLLHASYFTQFYQHSKKHLKVIILVVLNIGALL